MAVYPPMCISDTSTMAVYLAPASTLLPGCCPSGLLGLDSGFLLQTASWDAPQQTRAPAPLCLFLYISEQMLCTRNDLLVTQPH